jgi:glutathione S-transferase
VAGELSIADFAVASTFVYRKGSNISLEHVPHVSTWIDRLNRLLKKSAKELLAFFVFA